MRTVDVAWDQATRQFRAGGTHPGQELLINAPGVPGEPHAPTGFSATELLLAGVGACSAWDVVEILRKARQAVEAFSVRVTGEQDADPPWTYRRITVHYTFVGTGIDQVMAARAVRLSVERYCSVIATVQGVAAIEHTVTFEEGTAVPAA